MYNILLIEDHAEIAENISQFLSLEHYHIDIASDGTQGRALFSQNTYDIVILDLMLPGIDWITLCDKMKAISDTPIIMTTAKWQLEDKLEGFGVGADDYLVKPFDLPELSARITALLRRQDKFDVFTRKDIRVDLTKRAIYKGDEEIYLTIKEFYLLEVLVKNYGLPVSRADIVAHVRGEAEIWEESGKLDVYISNLRKKLDKSLIQTIPWFGYKIEKTWQ